MRSQKIVTLSLLCVTVSCLPGPDPEAYYFSKTVWVNDTDKENTSSSEFKRGEIQIVRLGVDPRWDPVSLKMWVKSSSACLATGKCGDSYSYYFRRV